jgi:hypothetical protein
MTLGKSTTCTRMIHRLDGKRDAVAARLCRSEESIEKSLPTFNRIPLAESTRCLSGDRLPSGFEQALK